MVTYNIYDWHKRRIREKSNEISLRKDRLLKEPLAINLNNVDGVKQLPWSSSSISELNEKWAYKPIQLIGQFDHSKEVKVKTIKNGEPGYEIITPFYCYRDSTGQQQALLVDRGWVPEIHFQSTIHISNAIGNMKIIGLVYKGNTSNKYRYFNNLILVKKIMLIRICGIMLI